MVHQRQRFYIAFWGFLLLMGCWLGVSSCKKAPEAPIPAPEAPKKVPEAPNEIFGEWQWISDVGGLSGKGMYTPENTKIERTYQFNRDSTFVECYNGQCKASVKFTLRMEKSIFDGQQHLIVTIPRRIYLAPPDTGFHIIKFRYSVVEMKEKLRLAAEMPDGFEESYSRK